MPPRAVTFCLVAAACESIESKSKQVRSCVRTIMDGSNTRTHFLPSSIDYYGVNSIHMEGCFDYFEHQGIASTSKRTVIVIDVSPYLQAGEMKFDNASIGKFFIEVKKMYDEEMARMANC